MTTGPCTRQKFSSTRMNCCSMKQPLVRYDKDKHAAATYKDTGKRLHIQSDLAAGAGLTARPQKDAGCAQLVFDLCTCLHN